MNKYFKIFLKHLGIFFIMGMVYMNLEIIATSLSGEFVSKYNTSYLALKGVTSLWMFFVGGFLGLIIGLFNENILWKFRLKIWICILLGFILIEITELLSGIILNIWLNLDIWDYSKYKFNFLGQIELFHALGFLSLTPLIIWFDDMLRYWIFNEGVSYPFYYNYIDLIFFD